MIAAVGLAAAVAVGCGKDKGNGAGGGGGGGAAGAAAASRSAFDLFPSTTRMIFGMNFASLTKSKIWADLEKFATQQAGDDIAKFKATCGMDPFTIVQSVVVGADPKDDKSAVVVVKGDLDRAKILDCAKKVAAQDGETVDIEEDGKIVGIKADGKTHYLAWLDDHTIVTGPRAENNKQALKDLIAAKDSITANKEFMALVNNTDPKATFWGAGYIPADAAGGGPRPKAVYGSVDMASGLKVDVVAQFETADDAKMTADQANQMMGMAKADPTMGKFVSKLSIAAADKDLQIKANFSDAEVGELIDLVKKQLPMMMMMGAGH
ncbi:MAG: hypothetical protein D6689_02250 [Deltaproteobacteria bacterium]|nr:MAG: hypothetical protein D6689_02250 [Deltaproteobacteria bacterium]